VFRESNAVFRESKTWNQMNRNSLCSPQAFGRTCILLLSASSVSNALELKPDTLQAWDEYIQAVEARLKVPPPDRTQFLWVDESPDRIRRVQAGEILIAPVGEHVPKHVPSGLIHHWMGAAFIPNTTLNNVFAVTRRYTRYKEFYKPLVIDAKPVSQTDREDKFSMLLRNKALLSKTALNGDYSSSYVQLSEKRWYSISYTTRIREIKDYGQPNERELEPDVGSGFIWRIYSSARFEERDGGVYVEIEAVALSRDIPAAFRPLVNPIVRRLSKSSVLLSLQQTREAVHSTTGAEPTTTATIVNMHSH
jgi:hypothetical protein